MNQWKVKEAMQDEMASNIKNILKMMNVKKQNSSHSLDSQHSISEERDGDE
jgi:hypothetical protein